jgi:hypothetical protein
MRHVWFAIVLLMTGCAEYPMNRDGTAWNPNGINYADPNAAPLSGSCGYNNYLSIPGCPGYSYLGYPCGSYGGCGTAVPVSSAVYVARSPYIARLGAGVSLRSGGRHRGRR